MQIINFVLIFLLALPSFASDTFDITTITNTTIHIDTGEISTLIGNIVTDTAAAAAAEELSCYVNSEEFTDQVDGFRIQILNEIFKDSLEEIAADHQINLDSLESGTQKARNSTTPLLAHDERIYLFISSSIPETTLKNYLRDLDRLRDPNIIVVMRGFIGGAKYMLPTTQWIEGLLNKQTTCSQQNCPRYQAEIIIDPMLFTQYGIDSVPAMVYTAGLRLRDPLASQGHAENILSAGTTIIASGDMPLSHFTRQILAHQSINNQQANRLKRLSELIQ